jgi:hypothetical protein
LHKLSSDPPRRTDKVLLLDVALAVEDAFFLEDGHESFSEALMEHEDVEGVSSDDGAASGAEGGEEVKVMQVDLENGHTSKEISRASSEIHSSSRKSEERERGRHSHERA